LETLHILQHLQQLNTLSLPEAVEEEQTVVAVAEEEQADTELQLVSQLQEELHTP
jgi:hypothetical protein